jgi:hypothetical protein
MSNWFQMPWKNACSVLTCMVKFHVRWNPPVLALVIDPMSHQEIPFHPNASIAVALSDGKNPTSSGLVNRDCNTIPARPLRDFSFRANSSDVFCVRNGLKVVWIHTSSISAQMVQFCAIWNWAVLLLPIPDVSKVRSITPAHARVTIGTWSTN